MDKRSEVEIQVGAVLNVLEPLESNLDDLLVRTVQDVETLPELLHNLILNRHHVYQARICAVRVFDKIIKLGAVYLGSLRSLGDAQADMNRARANVSEMDAYLIECRNPILLMVSKQDRQWAHQELWSGVLRRSTAAPGAIEAAIHAIIAGRATAKDDTA